MGLPIKHTDVNQWVRTAGNGPRRNLGEQMKVTFHRNATITAWDVYTQSWTRTAKPSASLLASMDESTRSRVIRHVGG